MFRLCPRNLGKSITFEASRRYVTPPALRRRRNNDEQRTNFTGWVAVLTLAAVGTKLLMIVCVLLPVRFKLRLKK